MSEPARVRFLEWSIACAVVIVATLGLVLPVGTPTLAVLLAAASCVLVATSAMDAVRTRALGKVLLMAGVLVFFWIEAVQLALAPEPFLVIGGMPGEGTPFPDLVVRVGLLEVALLQLGLLVGYALRPPMKRIFLLASSRVDARDAGRLTLRVVLVLAGLLAIGLTYFRDPEALRSALFDARNSNGAGGILRYAYDLGLFGACIGVADALAFPSSSVRSRIGLAILGVLGAAPYVLRGTRHHFVFIGLTIALIVLLKFPRDLSKRRAAGLVAIAAGLFFVLQAQWALRDFGWTQIQRLTPAAMLGAFNVGQFSSALLAIQLVPAQHAYFHEPATPYFFIHWIPRALWAGKPVMASWTWYNATYLTGATAALNVTPSIVGQYHINWGPLGVLTIGAWLGFLAVTADRLAVHLDVRRNITVLALVAMLLAFVVDSFRFYSPVYASYVVLGLVATLFLTRSSVRAEATG